LQACQLAACSFPGGPTQKKQNPCDLVPLHADASAVLPALIGTWSLMLVQRRNKKDRDQGGCPELVHPLTDPRSNSPAVPSPAFYWQLDQGSVLVARRRSSSNISGRTLPMVTLQPMI